MAIKELDLGSVIGPQGPKGDDGVVNADTTISFTQASNRSNIMTGESFKTIFGKLKKWYADLKTVAFTGNYADLTNKPNILPVGVKVSCGADVNDISNLTVTRVGNMVYVSGKVTVNTTSSWVSIANGLPIPKKNIPFPGVRTDMTAMIEWVVSSDYGELHAPVREKGEYYINGCYETTNA